MRNAQASAWDVPAKRPKASVLKFVFPAMPTELPFFERRAN